MDVPLQPSGNVTLMLHRNHQGTFRKGYTETTRNVLLRFSYNLLGTFPQGYPKTIGERYWRTFMNVWETFHFNVMGTLHSNVFLWFLGNVLVTFWERKIVGRVWLLFRRSLLPLFPMGMLWDMFPKGTNEISMVDNAIMILWLFPRGIMGSY